MDALLLDFWQTGCGHRLPMSLIFFIGDMKGDPVVEVRELDFQNMFCVVDNEIPALARVHATKNQHVLKIVEIRIMREGITEIRANGLIDFRRSTIGLSR